MQASHPKANGLARQAAGPPLHSSARRGAEHGWGKDGPKAAWRAAQPRAGRHHDGVREAASGHVFCCLPPAGRSTQRLTAQRPHAASCTTRLPGQGPRPPPEATARGHHAHGAVWLAMAESACPGCGSALSCLKANQGQPCPCFRFLRVAVLPESTPRASRTALSPPLPLSRPSALLFPSALQTLRVHAARPPAPEPARSHVRSSHQRCRQRH